MMDWRGSRDASSSEPAFSTSLRLSRVDKRLRSAGHAWAFATGCVRGRLLRRRVENDLSYDCRPARHATDQTCWTMWREAGYAPGRTCSIHASCGTREAGYGDAMSELSDADRRGSRQTRRDASMARSKAQKRSGCASDDARRRGSAMDGAGVPGRGAGANEERRQATPNALESAKRGSNRGRSGTEPSRLRRVAQDCDPKTYSCMSSGRKDARIAKARRRVPLPRIEPHIDKAGRPDTSASSRLASRAISISPSAGAPGGKTQTITTTNN